MKKTLLFISLCFSPILSASEYMFADSGISLSVSSSHSAGRLGIQNQSIKDLANSGNPYQHSPAFSTLKLSKIWSDSSAWKLYSTHLISSSFLQLDSGYYAAPTLSLNHGASGFSMNNRLSLRKRYSSALVITPAIALNMLSGNSLSTSTANDFYPFPIMGLNNNENLYSFNTGVDMNGLFGDNWGYSADLEFAYLANNNGMYAWKSEALLFYQWQGNSKLLFGYKYIDGQDHEQRNVHIYPVIDFLWSW